MFPQLYRCSYKASLSTGFYGLAFANSTLQFLSSYLLSFPCDSYFQSLSSTMSDYCFSDPSFPYVLPSLAWVPAVPSALTATFFALTLQVSAQTLFLKRSSFQINSKSHSVASAAWWWMQYHAHLIIICYHIPRCRS